MYTLLWFSERGRGRVTKFSRAEAFEFYLIWWHGRGRSTVVLGLNVWFWRKAVLSQASHVEEDLQRHVRQRPPKIAGD